MSSSTISLRTTTSLAERIDHSASRQGLSRSAYVMQWLPEAYDYVSETSDRKAANNEDRSQRKRTPSTTITLRVSEALTDRIDQNAERQGKTRTDYILQWTPDYWRELESQGASETPLKLQAVAV